MPKPDKYGSPYDPNNKMLRSEKQEQRREEENHQLRGCSDPNCNQCNPHTAGISPFAGVFSGRRTSQLTSARSGTAEAASYANLASGGSGLKDYQQAMIDMVLSNIKEPEMYVWSIGASEYSGLFPNTPSPPPSPPKPPASYDAARKAVEQWLITSPEQNFDDIVGNAEALEQLRDAIQAPVVHADLYAAYGMKMPKGALLEGPPGCGKTMFARAAASEMSKMYKTPVEFISISAASTQSPYIGVTEGYIINIFKFAREYKAFHGRPLLVFIDEAEVLFPDRTGRIRRVASWEESNVATFLAEMDGIQESGAFVLLATNRPEVIDQAVLRDGRCDFKIKIRRPTQEAVEAILRKNFAGVLVAPGVDIDTLVMTATESLFDPSRIIADAGVFKADFEERKISMVDHRHFLLEHIVSGAMAASIPNRAKRYAFSRDKAEGVARGVIVDDVIRAVNDLFNENKGLEHEFAMNEFKAQMMAEAQEKQ